MAANLLSDLDLLLRRITMLGQRIESLEEEKRALEARNQELERDAREAVAAKERAELDAQFLALSHKLADSPDTLADARRHLATLIRNIDRCLEMLKE